MAEGEEEVADDGDESLDEIATRKPSPTRALRSFLRRSARRRRERLSASAAPDAWICTASTAIATTTTDTQVRHGWAGLRVHLTRVSNVSSRGAQFDPKSESSACAANTQHAWGHGEVEQTVGGHGLGAASARCPTELGVLHHHAIAAPMRRQVARV